MKKFEYTLLDVPAKSKWTGKIDLEKLTEQLNELGSKGWEVVSNVDASVFEGASTGTIIILKREKP